MWATNKASCFKELLLGWLRWRCFLSISLEEYIGFYRLLFIIFCIWFFIFEVHLFYLILLLFSSWRNLIFTFQLSLDLLIIYLYTFFGILSILWIASLLEFIEIILIRYWFFRRIQWLRNHFINLIIRNLAFFNLFNIYNILLYWMRLNDRSHLK